MRFPIPSTSVNACLLSWRSPVEFPARAKNVRTEGVITEIEVWQIITPSSTSADVPFSMNELDYDNLSYSTLPAAESCLAC